MAVALRISMLLPLLLLGSDVAAGTTEQIDEGLVIEDAFAPTLSWSIIAREARPSVNLEQVWWTTFHREPLKRLADRWGTSVAVLRALNPGLADPVEAGERLLVRDARPGTVSRSVGAPNRGRVEHAVPFPEGPKWQLRPWRARAYGTERVVAQLMIAFDAFGRRHPDAHPIVVGELSSRSGGRIRPHSSHQSGRDVDLGYVVSEPAPPNGRWPKVTPETFDAEINWSFVRALVETGEVERIFIDARLQRQLLEAARSELPEEDLGQWFSVAAPTRRAASRATIAHWAGHDDHLHVRFRCSDTDVRCDTDPPKRKRRPKGKSKGKRKSKSKGKATSGR
jgi:murein endopeptidase